MKIADFVAWELDMYRKECNFTDEELEFFNLRARNKSLVQIQDALHCRETKASELSKSVKKKILKIPPKIVQRYREDSE